MYRIATRAVMVSKSAWKIDANCAARPLVVEVPETLRFVIFAVVIDDDAAVVVERVVVPERLNDAADKVPDMYRFVVGSGKAGEFSAEVVAERLPDA